MKQQPSSSAFDRRRPVTFAVGAVALLAVLVITAGLGVRALFAATVLQSAQVPVWPILGGSAQRTGQSPYAGPAAPQLKWSAPLTMTEGVGSPIVHSPLVGTTRVYAATNQDWRFAFDRQTGERLWAFRGGSETHSALGMEGALFVFPRPQFNDVMLDGIAASGERVWRFPFAFGNTTPLLVDGGVLYAAWTKDQRVYAINAATGASLWSYRTGSAGVYGGGMALVPDGPLIVSYNQSGSPSTGHVMALDRITGSLLWSVQVGDYPSMPSVGLDGTIYVSSRPGLLMALENETGAERWRTALPADMRTPAVAAGADNALYVGMDNDLFASYSAADGSLRWQVTLAGATSAMPLLDITGRIYVALTEGILQNNLQGMLYALRA